MEPIRHATLVREVAAVAILEHLTLERPVSPYPDSCNWPDGWKALLKSPFVNADVHSYNITLSFVQSMVENTSESDQLEVWIHHHGEVIPFLDGFKIFAVSPIYWMLIDLFSGCSFSKHYLQGTILVLHKILFTLNNHIFRCLTAVSGMGPRWLQCGGRGVADSNETNWTVLTICSIRFSAIFQAA